VAGVVKDFSFEGHRLVLDEYGKVLVTGHGRDPIHPFSDSDMLLRELPNARLIEASSILELRLTPERLTGEIVAFVEDCFRPTRASGPPS
jgi:hypothetical protein